MTEEEKIVARSWYDPRYEIVDLSDYAWWVDNGFHKRIKLAYEAKVISQQDYDFMCAEEPLDEESTEICHEIMVKMGLLRRIARA